MLPTLCFFVVLALIVQMAKFVSIKSSDQIIFVNIS